ncbi:MAG TPA: histidine kinase [Firmicutes bacterium]|nr:histidine kinase [Bacillota bacterium]
MPPAGPGDVTDQAVGHDATLWTNATRCRDCNRCVRSCPVKAVRKEGGQARIGPENCILCGICVRECPQGAKSYRSQVSRVEHLIRTAPLVAASVAPSYMAAFTPAEQRGLPGVLRGLGFGLVAETAVGAEMVARASRGLINQNPTGRFICTACPAVVRYIQRYKPEAVGALFPLASPMTAHARYLKTKYGPQTAVVFIGPCLAKKDEALREECQPSVDAVLTFDELIGWVKSRGLSFVQAEESSFDDFRPTSGRLFPVSGGFAKTAGFSTDRLDWFILTATGPNSVREAVDFVTQAKDPVVMDALVCPGGCLGGVGIPQESSRFALRMAFLNSVGKTTEAEAVKGLEDAKDSDTAASAVAAADLTVHYPPDLKPIEAPDEAHIREVMARTGKYESSDELDCGACGYNTCREKAIAVIAGMAEIDMCIPFMRRSAELKTDAIVHNSPNAIVILDRELKIVHVNKKFCEMFMTSEHCRGRHISYFMDAEPYRRVIEGETARHDAILNLSAYGLVCQQVIYEIGEADSLQLVGILINLTHIKKQEAELDVLRREAIDRAEEVIDRQVEIVQEIVKHLAKSAAETRSTLTRLTDLVERKEDR